MDECYVRDGYDRAGCPARCGFQGAPPVPSPVEVSEYLVGSPAFKAGGTGDPRPAGSIPVHLRQSIRRNGPA